MVTEKASDRGRVRVFVYGTLKTGHIGESLIQKSGGSFLGYDNITGPFALYNLGGFPALQDKEGESNEIRGQVFALGDEGLAALDHYEGHPNFFTRRKLWSQRLRKRVWVYFMNHKEVTRGRDRVVSGMWNPLSDEESFWSYYDKESANDGESASRPE